MISRADENEIFLEAIVFLNEVKFHISCKLHDPRETTSMSETALKSMPVLIGHIVGPLFYKETNGWHHCCLNMLQQFSFTVDRRLGTIFVQYDCATSHTGHRVFQFRRETFADEWLSRSGSFAWPPRLLCLATLNA
jgi:hypothetical protein